MKETDFPRRAEYSSAQSAFLDRQTQREKTIRIVPANPQEIITALHYIICIDVLDDNTAE